MGSIQLGIQHAVGGLASKPERDLLMQDFMTVETTNFPSEGSNHTPAHHFSEFKFKNYAPIAFRYFRDLFGIQPDDFLVNINCSTCICSYVLRSCGRVMRRDIRRDIRIDHESLTFPSVIRSSPISLANWRHHLTTPFEYSDVDV